MELSRALLELKPLFLSIVGAPASGKSYLLGAMTWELRRRLPELGFTFLDADPEANHALHEYEQALFLSSEPDTPAALPKTETGGNRVYRTISVGGQSMVVPRSFQFSITTSHREPGRVLVLYDNAGEHFLPGQDVTQAPVTRHLAKSSAILFVFDPTQDPRFRDRCVSQDPQLVHGLRAERGVAVTRQETVLSEAVARVRRFRGIAQDALVSTPLVIVLAKADIWAPTLLSDALVEPFSTESNPPTLDTDVVSRMSERCHALMQEVCPEFASVADAFSSDVTYVPTSSLGRSPELVERNGERFYGIRPNAVQPQWVTVPLIYALYHAAPALFLSDLVEPARE